MIGALLAGWLSCASVAEAAGDAQQFIDDLNSVEMPESPLEPPPDAATAEERTERLQTNLRCPVCQGLSVSDSPADAARAMGDRIEELVLEGYTEEQVTRYFVDRYGEWVELEPPREDHQALFWAPVVAVFFGIGGIAWFGRRRREANTNERGYTPDPELAPWRERILAELDGEA